MTCRLSKRRQGRHWFSDPLLSPRQRPPRRMTGGRKRRDLLQCVFMPPTNDGDNTKQCRRPSYAAHALPHFPSGWSWLLGEECTERGEGKKGGKKDKPPHGTFFSRASPSSSSTLLALSFLLLLSGSLSRWMELRLRRKGGLGFPFYPTLKKIRCDCKRRRGSRCS